LATLVKKKKKKERQLFINGLFWIFPVSLWVESGSVKLPNLVVSFILLLFFFSSHFHLFFPSSVFSATPALEMTWNSPFVATQLKRWDCSSASKFLEPAFHLFYLCIHFVYFDWVIPDLSFSYCKRERASESDRKVIYFFFKCFDPLLWRTKGAAWIKEIMIQVDMSISRWFRASQVEGRGGKEKNIFFFPPLALRNI